MNHYFIAEVFQIWCFR